MIMKLKNLLALISAIVCASMQCANAGMPLPRSTPEEQGVSSSRLLEYVAQLDRQVDGMHSVMILRHGSVIAEGWWTPYKAESRHTMYSLSKSFTSTAVGLAQAEGKLSVDDTVVSFFPELVPPNASANLKAMRVRDLLAMSTGHHNEDISKFDYMSEDAVKQFLAIPVAHKPGTHFVYNTPGSFMLSAIVQKATGQSVLDYLQPRLFKPLGIDDPIWDAGKTGINLGGFGLHIRTEDIAKFGLLYLREGQWQGKELLPKSWVRAASTRQTSNGSNPKSDWDQGYGYQFWRCRNGAFRGDGAFGQYCVVMPEQDAVLAITSGVRDMQKVLDVTWDHLLPALKENAAAVAKDEGAQKRLAEKLAALTLRAIEGEKGSTVAEHAAAKLFKFESNPAGLETVAIRQSGDGTTFAARVNGKDYKFDCAPGKWRQGKFAWAGISALESEREEPAAASGAWNGNVFTVKIAFTETPYVLTLKMDFSGDALTVEPEMNVAFAAAKKAALMGRQ
jgi:CubicO group peptidase (beta-lactamase class C family)